MMNSPSLEGRFERTLGVSGQVRLEVAVGSGSIRIKAGAAGSVQISGIVRARPSFFGFGNPEHRIHELETNPPIEQLADAIRIGCTSAGWFTGRIFFLLDIIVPAETMVRAESGGGDIRIDGICGPVDCRTDSGEIEASNIGADLRVEADSGRIRIERVSGSVYAAADSGNIEALEIAGPIDARTDSGGIRLSQTTAAPVRAAADSGTIRLRLAPGAGYNLQARSGSGAIRTPPMTYREGSANEVTGQVLGGGPDVELGVDSGGIEIEQ